MKKSYQRIPPETLNVLLTLVRHTDNAQMNFVNVCQLGGAVIIFSESWNYELKTFMVKLSGKK